MNNETIFTNAVLVLPDSTLQGTIVLHDARIADVQSGRSAMPSAQDLDGDFLIAGIVDTHTDNLERQVQPRALARWPSRSAMVAHDAQCAGAGGAVIPILRAVDRIAQTPVARYDWRKNRKIMRFTAAARGRATAGKRVARS